MELTKEQFLHDFKDILHEEQLIKVEDATSAELFQTLARTIRKYITPMWLERRNKLVEDKQKIAYYFSIEFPYDVDISDIKVKIVREDI